MNEETQVLEWIAGFLRASRSQNFKNACFYLEPKPLTYILNNPCKSHGIKNFNTATCIAMWDSTSGFRKSLYYCLHSSGEESKT